MDGVGINNAKMLTYISQNTHLKHQINWCIADNQDFQFNELLGLFHSVSINTMYMPPATSTHVSDQ